MKASKFAPRYGLAMVAGLALVASSHAGVTRFYYRQLKSFPGGRTQSMTIDQNGVISGKSGDFGFGQHAFLSDTSGVLINIDTLGCADSEPTAVNAVGQLAVHGAWKNGSTWTMAVLRYTPGVGLENLGAPGPANGNPVAINVHGDIVGYWSTKPFGGDAHAFLYTDARGMKDLGTLGGTESAASDINDAGQIVGRAHDANDVSHAVVWQNGGIVDLGLGGAVAINEAGLVIGNQPVGGEWHAFYWTAASGSAQLVPLPAEADFSTAIAVNENGTILGVWGTGFQTQNAFLYTPGQPRVDLEPPAGYMAVIPEALNNAGHIVGRLMDEMYESQAFIYTPQQGFVELATAVSPPLTWWGMQPIAINDADEIIVNAFGGTAEAASAVFAPVILGDLNCDGVADFADINPFVLAVSDPQAFAAAYPKCFIESGDIDRNGRVEFLDISPFVALLAR